MIRRIFVHFSKIWILFWNFAIGCKLNIPGMQIVSKNKIYLHSLWNRPENLTWARFSVSKASTNKLYIFRVSKWVLFNFSAILWHAQVIINGIMMMMSALYQTNTFNWICIVLAHWDNSPCVAMLLHSFTLSWLTDSKPTSLCSYSLI